MCFIIFFSFYDKYKFKGIKRNYLSQIGILAFLPKLDKSKPFTHNCINFFQIHLFTFK